MKTIPRLQVLSVVILFLSSALPVVSVLATAQVGSAETAPQFDADILPFLQKYCFDCHAGDDPAGEVDFSLMKSDEVVVGAFELWAKVDELIQERKMPPEDEAQPSSQERLDFRAWYREKFVRSVEAKPGTFRPRRLSANEYRNTLRTLFGFDLEVAIMEAEQTVAEKSLVLKLLPTDPPGKSGYRNDTYSNPLSTHIWEQYAYLADFAIEELFSNERTNQLESLAGPIATTGFDQANAEKLVREFVHKAWRRPNPDGELQKIVSRIENDSDSVAAAKRELKSALMSPAFVYRGLLMRGTPGKQQPVDDYELAERLSYFLWSDMPDDELFALASSGKLSERRTLRMQVQRMLDSPKAESLATDFATQWLLLNEIEHVSDNVPVMVALKSQPIDFFQYLIAEDRPLVELIDSNTTFVSPLTRKYYVPDTKQLGKYRRPKGIEIEIVANQKMKLENTVGRGGLLTMPGVLAMNRGPILRGVWLLERILGDHLPDPPADVGQVEANIPGEDLSFRERFEKHRSNASCAVCHDKIDPLGFALDAYDSKGGYALASDYKKSQKQRRSESPPANVDTSGRLPSGEEFADFEELKQLLLSKKRETIVRNIVEQMLAYALCRKLEIYDQPTVESIVNELSSREATWRDLILAIVQGLPFRETIVAVE